jgi:hypothetical protein
MERDGRAVALKICANDYQGANQEVEILSYAKHHVPLNDFVVEFLDHDNRPENRPGAHEAVYFDSRGLGKA